MSSLHVSEPQPENMVKEIAKREGRDPIEYLYEHFLTRDGRGATYQCGIGYGVNTPYGANTLDGACVPFNCDWYRFGSVFCVFIGADNVCRYAGNDDTPVLHHWPRRLGCTRWCPDG